MTVHWWDTPNLLDHTRNIIIVTSWPRRIWCGGSRGHWLHQIYPRWHSWPRSCTRESIRIQDLCHLGLPSQDPPTSWSYCPILPTVPYCKWFWWRRACLYHLGNLAVLRVWIPWQMRCTMGWAETYFPPRRVLARWSTWTSISMLVPLYFCWRFRCPGKCVWPSVLLW